jgi:Uma2 family endonuclease
LWATMAAMVSSPTSEPIDPGDYVPTADDRIVMRVDWDGFEALLEIRGDCAGPRMAYLDGVVELMSPSQGHEGVKSGLGRLLEHYCLARNILFTPYGSWLLKKKKKKAGVEPDECYCFGPDPKRKTRPDLAIEVEWTRGGIDKLEIYARLGVDEVWFWKRESITVYGLVEDRYVEREQSVWVPGIDLAVLCEIAKVTPTNEAIRLLHERMPVAR